MAAEKSSSTALRQDLECAEFARTALVIRLRLPAGSRPCRRGNAGRNRWRGGHHGLWHGRRRTSHRGLNTTFAAPGKIVLWGEYAVLAGAPAAVMAVDRYAQATLTPGQSLWRYSASGFMAPALHTAEARPPQTAVTRIARAVLDAWGLSAFPDPFALHCDTRALHQGAAKLGIGSSAAATVATYASLADALQREATCAEAIGIHRALQGGGSGLDVAAAWHGGVTRFQDGEADVWSWPEALAWQVIWTGSVAHTGTHIADFAAWRAQENTGVLDALSAASEAAFATLNQDALISYTDALARLDDAAGLGIYTQAHRKIATIAHDRALVYKPCGAGGGDIGIAFGTDRQALSDFATAVQAAGFYAPDMEIAQHGVRQL